MSSVIPAASAATGVAPTSAPARDAAPSRNRGTPAALAALIAVIGTSVTGALTLATLQSNLANEERLLAVQTRQAAAVLSGAILTIQDPLATAVRVAVVTEGDVTQFEQVMGPLTGPDRTFVSVSLLRDRGGELRSHRLLGADPLIDAGSPDLRALVARAGKAQTFAVRSAGTGRVERVAYAATDPTSGWVIYAERAIPPNRLVPAVSTPAFANLDFATYIGPDQDPDELATTNQPLTELPLRGMTSSETVRFGDTVLTLVARPSRPLGGTATAVLPWIVLGAGVVITGVSALAGARLMRQRLRAERDASTISELYSTLDGLYRHQRGIAETLQHALLPRSDPIIDGVEIGTRYVAGARGVEIGGDWYSVVALDQGRFAFVIGDVSGRGVEAAALMARLRFTLRAYLIEGHRPDRVLDMTNTQIDLVSDGHFATCLVGIADPRTGEVTLANAGHPEPLLVRADGATAVPTDVGPPLGIGSGSYRTSSVTVPDGAVLLLFTDGLFERREESIDTGLNRLAAAAAGVDAVLDDYVTRLIQQLTGLTGEDDVAVLAIRRTHQEPAALPSLDPRPATP